MMNPNRWPIIKKTSLIFKRLKSVASKQQARFANLMAIRLLLVTFKVQIKRTEGFCIVLSGVTPEHNERSKCYRVEVQIDILEGRIKLAVCHDCVASEGGCKHAFAMVAWLHRRSDAKTVTEDECYWKRSKLSKVGSTMKYVLATSINRNSIETQKIPRKVHGEVNGEQATSIKEEIRSLGFTCIR